MLRPAIHRNWYRGDSAHLPEVHHTLASICMSVFVVVLMYFLCILNIRDGSAQLPDAYLGPLCLMLACPGAHRRGPSPRSSPPSLGRSLGFGGRAPQRAEYPVIEESTLNHIKDACII